MSYVVLARKWRPQTFADLTGQQHVATTLTNAIERERVPHAMLFTGARGVGKTSTARILSMALNCATGPTTTPCGTCDSCVEIQQGRSVDVLEIDGASNRGINEIRELRDGVRYAPHRDRHKIYIIDEVHMLTTEAFNALLKTLEEPPEHVVFLFATTEAHKIPVTILSRCQRFDFRRIPHGEIVQRLQHITSSEGLDVDDEVLALIARQAAGGMRDALSLMDQVIAFAGTTIHMDDAAGILGAAERRRLFELTAAVLAHDVDAALRVLDAVVAFGVNLPHFAADVVAHLRDLVVVSVSRDPSGLTALTDSELAEARTQAASTDAATLHRMFEIMVGAAEEIARSNHASLVFEMAIVRMAALEPLHRLDEIIARLDAIAGGATLPPGGGPTGGGLTGGGSTGGGSARAGTGGSSEPAQPTTANAGPASTAAVATQPVAEAPAEPIAAQPEAAAARTEAEAPTETVEPQTDTIATHADPAPQTDAVEARPEVGATPATADAHSGSNAPIETDEAQTEFEAPAEAQAETVEAQAEPEAPTEVVEAPTEPEAPTETVEAQAEIEAQAELAAPTETVEAQAEIEASTETVEAQAGAEQVVAAAPSVDEPETCDEPTEADQARPETVAAEPASAAPTEVAPAPVASETGTPVGDVVIDGPTWRAAVRDVRDSSERTSALLVGATLVHAEPGFARIAVDDSLLGRWTADDTVRLVDALAARIGAPPRVEVVPEGDVDDTVLESGYQVHREIARERAAHVERVRAFVLSHRVIESVQQHWPSARVTEIHVPELPEETRP